MDLILNFCLYSIDLINIILILDDILLSLSYRQKMRFFTRLFSCRQYLSNLKLEWDSKWEIIVVGSLRPCERQAVCSTRLRSRPSTNPSSSLLLNFSFLSSLLLHPFEFPLSLSVCVCVLWGRGFGRRNAEEYETIASLESQESLEPVGVWLAIRSVSFNCACSLSYSLSLSLTLLTRRRHRRRRQFYLLHVYQRVSGEVYRLPTSHTYIHIYICIRSYICLYEVIPVPFSDVSLVATLQRMSTPYIFLHTLASFSLLVARVLSPSKLDSHLLIRVRAATCHPITRRKAKSHKGLKSIGFIAKKKKKLYSHVNSKNSIDVFLLNIYIYSHFL